MKIVLVIDQKTSGVRHEWRCPREFCVLANVNSNDRGCSVDLFAVWSHNLFNGMF